jgi:hypothetical protein
MLAFATTGTDRYWGRVMFPVVSALTIILVLFVGFVADSYPLLVPGGFFLGIGGTAFAVGVPVVSAWFPHRSAAASPWACSGSAWAEPSCPHSPRSASPTPTAARSRS